MIGQENIIKWVEKNKYIMPHFIVLVGDKGSGKQTLSKYIANKISAIYIPCEINVDSIREIIDNSYKVKDKILYCIANADTMSLASKNAMLKITEEPPANCYFVLTVQDDSSLLDTIKSRAQVFNMEPYKKSDLKNYLFDTFLRDCGGWEIEMLCNIAHNPYQIGVLINYGKDFIDYVNLVIDNIGQVQSCNAFKSSTKLALKNEEGKYDLLLFWAAFMELCVLRLRDEPLHYAEGVCITSRYYLKGTKLGVNKQQIYDMWTLDIREVWN